MNKQRFCKGCDFFKKNENICNYYDSNTYPDTPACSKYKGEEGDEDSKSSTDELITSESSTEIVKQDVKNKVNSDVIAHSDTYTTPAAEKTSDKVEGKAKENTEDENKVASDSSAKKTSLDNSVPKSADKERSVAKAPAIHIANINQVYTPERIFSHPFSFHGRIRRYEYGLSLIIYYIVYFIITLLSFAVTSNDVYEYDAETNANILAFILMLPAYWFLLAQGAKRCHDRNNSGWYQIIPFYSLWMLFADGDDHENDYGTPPKAFYHGKRVVVTSVDDGDVPEKNNKNAVGNFTTIVNGLDNTNNNRNIGSNNNGTGTGGSNGNKNNLYLWFSLAIVIVMIVISIIISMNSNSSDQSYEDFDSTSDSTAVVDSAYVDSFDYGENYPSSDRNLPENNSYSPVSTTESTEDYSSDDVG